MMRHAGFSSLFNIVFTLGALSAPALADSTNLPPVLPSSEVALDVATLPWLNDTARQYLTELNAGFVSGQTVAYVMVASPSGNWGVRSAVAGGIVPPAQTELARQALEQCEYYNKLPCYIVAMNGKSMHDPVAGFAPQPYMLDNDVKRFDYAEVPFVPEVDRLSLRGYQTLASPKAMALSDTGYWATSGGATGLEAITSALSTCKAGNSGQADCSLYAVEDRIVMDLAR